MFLKFLKFLNYHQILREWIQFRDIAGVKKNRFTCYAVLELSEVSSPNPVRNIHLNISGGQMVINHQRFLYIFILPMTMTELRDSGINTLDFLFKEEIKKGHLFLSYWHKKCFNQCF